MALWGNKDNKTATGGLAIAANGLVSGTGTLLDTEAKIGDYILIGGKKHLIVSITSNTVAQVSDAGVLGGSIGVQANGVFALQELPKYVSASSVGEDANTVFGVDTTEAGVTAGVSHAGWVKRTVGTGNKTGRVFQETLVASSSITGDAADDTEFPDV